MTHLRQLLLLILLPLGVVVAELAAATEVSRSEQGSFPVRVLSQTVGTDELLLALAEPGQIAALSQLSTDARFTSVAREASKYPQLPVNCDAETALNFKPTLVLCADYSRVEFVSQIRRAGVRVIIFTKYRTLEDSYDNLRLLAKELGAEAKAERIIADCEARVAFLRARLAGLRPVKVIVPSIYGVIAGSKTTFQDLCDHACADNLASSLGGLVGHQAPPGEKMLGWPIEKLVVAGVDVAEGLAPFKAISPYQYMPAVREGRVALIPNYILSCVTHHRVEGYEALAHALHPEAFAAEVPQRKNP